MERNIKKNLLAEMKIWNMKENLQKEAKKRNYKKY